MTSSTEALTLGMDHAVELSRFEFPDPAPSQVRVRMLAAPINPADLNMIQGVYPIKPGDSAILGIEGVGEIEKVGIAVSGFKAGQWVVMPGVVGCWTQRMLVDGARLISLPPGLPAEQAAMAVVNPCTAYRMLKDFTSLKPGDWVVQNAANSAVGRYVIHLAKHWRLNTLNIVRRPELVDELKEEGASAVVVLGEGDLNAQIEQATGGASILLGLNGTGGHPLRAVTQALTDGGTVVTYGAMSREPFRLSNADLIFRNIKARGFWITRWFQQANAPARQDMMAEIFPLIRSGHLASPIEKKYLLSEYREALDHAQREKRAGKILFTMG